MPQLDRPFAAFLFDMDGTLIDSTAAAERVWARWSERHGLDPAAVIAVMHGVRAEDTVRRVAPHLDAIAEGAAITNAEIDDVAGIVAIPGAECLLRSLPRDRWAIATSAPRDLALRRLEATGLPVPEAFVTAADITRGKPAPDCYLAAADKLGAPIGDCLVFEDAPPGIASGEAAGAAVLVIGWTHAKPLDTPHPMIRSYDAISVRSDDGLRVTFAAEPS